MVFDYLVRKIGLIIGTSQLNPPFETLLEGTEHFFGFDIDIMMEICRRINRQCQFKPFLFTELIPAIENGGIDIAIASIIITPARRKIALFSIPYLQSEGRFITLNDSKIESPEDMPGKVVGVGDHAPYKALVKEIYKGKARVKTYPNISELMLGLNNKQVDAALLDNEAAKYWAYNVSSKYELIGSALPAGQGYGIMTQKNNKALMVLINKAILDMEDDGKYLEIYRQYFSLN